MDIFADDAFACFIMEQEGIFDCRSRQEKIEDIIQELAAANPLDIDIHLLEQMCDCNHLYDASVSEIAYIVEETNRRKEFF
jgi:hypothetical protein